MKKSQISLEILFSIGFVIFIFIILLAFTMERRQDVRETEATLKEKAECYKLSNLISGVYTAGKGTGLIETLEYDVDIDVEEGSIFVGEGEFFCNFPVSSVKNPNPPEGQEQDLFSLCEGSITLNHTGDYVAIKNDEEFVCGV